MPIVGVSALIVRNREILMVLRAAHKPLGGRWSLPGGHVEEGETLEQALRREVLEETGLRIKVGDVFAALSAPPRRNSYVVICYRASVTGGRLRAGDDAEEAEWVRLDDLHRRRVTPALLTVLRKAGLVTPLARGSASTRGSPGGRTRPAGPAR